MRQLGTDMLAVVCIVGGGVVAGGVTLALAARPELPSLACATTVGNDPDVVVSLGGEGLVVVTPDVRLRAVKECVAQATVEDLHVERVELDRERIKREVERARREADRVREEVDRVRDRVDRVRGREVERVDRVRRVRREQLDRARGRLQVARIQVRGAEGSDHQIHLEGLEDLDFDFDFDFDFDDMEDMEFEFEGLDEALELRLEALERLDFEFEGVDEDMQREIRQRVEEEMKRLQDRFERVGTGNGSGR